MHAESKMFRLSPCLMVSKRYRWTAILAVLTILSIFFLFQNCDCLSQRAPRPNANTDIDWSRFAYIHKADRVIMFPSRMLKSDDDSSNDVRLLRNARDKYNVNLIPITIQRRNGADMPVAMPRAYWLWPDREILSAHVMVIEPSQVEFGRIMAKINSASGREYDMEIINSLYRDSALVLAHRGYAMLTGEFRSDNHTMYLGSDVEIWDPSMAYSESKLIHFSDWPLPKPWLPMSEEQRTKLQPDCTTTADGTEDCTARIIWNSLYADFKKKRKVIAPPKVSSDV
ncbi:hypothetical protein NCS57_00685000 [Fusarium keratoplasticum]|uniref:Uncharacterized protein n=1 Tax=Fusarium keratoplasticum TaxID=1328300 RepID=A0ACC0QYJ0_9HYPO|nr:hypothetical protein NCS57_00685000 [Fusarium keratoplasticum]KAI8668727.1 hypothetical protein NCS57_00685000 [Fusarium keratoplasticum]